jgi:cobalt-precorrin-5B (C1)-methyltransferase
MMSDDNVGAGTIELDGKQLRCGYTTGTCATAATKAAVTVLLTGKSIGSVDVITPCGRRLFLKIREISEEDGSVTCSVMKDGGDDIDATHGMLIRSTVTKRSDGAILIDGGAGIGRVTRRGLDQPVGNAAINHVPREMMLAEAEAVCRWNDYKGGLDIVISAPAGVAVAQRTFNPRLGIEGGISILGTSGIVEPMSEKALVESIKVEMNMRAAEGAKYILVVPGNYGRDFSQKDIGLDTEKVIQCSNFVGETLDHARTCGIKGLLLVGNVGKLVKVAGGIMNTHSRYADCRMEILASNAILAGANEETAKEIMGCVMTDDAIGILMTAGILERTMDQIMGRIGYYIKHRLGEGMEFGVVMFSTKYGKLGEYGNVKEITKELEMMK